MLLRVAVATYPNNKSPCSLCTNIFRMFNSEEEPNLINFKIHVLLKYLFPSSSYSFLLSSPPSNKNHRTIECFGLEGTFRGPPAQPPCSEQGHLHLD